MEAMHVIYAITTCMAIPHRKGFCVGGLEFRVATSKWNRKGKPKTLAKRPVA